MADGCGRVSSGDQAALVGAMVFRVIAVDSASRHVDNPSRLLLSRPLFLMTTGAEPIICRSTRWYHIRRIPMLLLVFGYCAWFIYDWQIGYPRAREAQMEWNRIKEEKGPEKVAEIEAAYAPIAKEKGWPEKVDESKDYDWLIKWEQPAFAILTGAGGLLMLYFYIRTTRGVLRADDTSFSTAGGQHVPFASAFRIDRRKWDHKGLAYVYYKDDKGGEKRAVIDDLVFGGAVKVLERLQANFKGEVIDLESKEIPAGEKKESEMKPEIDEGGGKSD